MAEAAARNIDGADINVDGGEYDDDLAGSDPSDVDESLPTRGAWTPEQRLDIEALSRRVERVQTQDCEQLSRNKFRVGAKGFVEPAEFHEGLHKFVLELMTAYGHNVASLVRERASLIVMMIEISDQRQERTMILDVI